MEYLLQLITAPIRLLIKWHLRKPRSFTFGEIKITVLPGVFHPGFFHSTKMILNYMQEIELKDQSFLELGSGTGIVSVSAALQNAKVTAIDISELSIRNTVLNQKKNNVNFTTIQSDLFDQIPPTTFDWIVINPPYYASNPVSEADYAWYCGEDHEYFEKLFSQLSKFIHTETKMLIILSAVCDMETIFRIAKTNGFRFEKILEKKVWVDGRNYLFFLKSKV